MPILDIPVEMPVEIPDRGNEIYEPSEDDQEKNALAWVYNWLFRRP